MSKLDVNRVNIHADEKVKRYEYINNYTRFIHELLDNRTFVRGNLYDAFIAYHEFYATDIATKKINALCKKIDGLHFKQQNKEIVKGILPVVVRYCKYLHELRKDSDFYKRTDLMNI